MPWKRISSHPVNGKNRFSSSFSLYSRCGGVIVEEQGVEKNGTRYGSQGKRYTSAFGRTFRLDVISGMSIYYISMLTLRCWTLISLAFSSRCSALLLLVVVTFGCHYIYTAAIQPPVVAFPMPFRRPFDATGCYVNAHQMLINARSHSRHPSQDHDSPASAYPRSSPVAVSIRCRGFGYSPSLS